VRFSAIALKINHFTSAINKYQITVCTSLPARQLSRSRNHPTFRPFHLIDHPTAHKTLQNSARSLPACKASKRTHLQPFPGAIARIDLYGVLGLVFRATGPMAPHLGMILLDGSRRSGAVDKNSARCVLTKIDVIDYLMEFESH
jgi:hypothetical protein